MQLNQRSWNVPVTIQGVPVAIKVLRRVKK